MSADVVLQCYSYQLFPLSNVDFTMVPSCSRFHKPCNRQWPSRWNKRRGSSKDKSHSVYEISCFCCHNTVSSSIQLHFTLGGSTLAYSHALWVETGIDVTSCENGWSGHRLSRSWVIAEERDRCWCFSLQISRLWWTGSDHSYSGHRGGPWGPWISGEMSANVNTNIWSLVQSLIDNNWLVMVTCVSCAIDGHFCWVCICF